MTAYGSPLSFHSVRRVRRLRLRAQRTRLRVAATRRRTLEAALVFDPSWTRGEEPSHVRAA